MGLKNVRWDITGNCNLSCRHCQASKYYDVQKCRADVSTSEALTIIDKLDEYGVERVGLLGGEPLLRKDIMEILRYLKSKDMIVALNTNATFLENFDIDEILDCVSNVVVSIDGICEQEHDEIRGTGNFNKTIKNTKELIRKKKKQNIGVSLVLNQYNYKSSKHIYEFMTSLDVDFCMVDVVHRTGNAEENWDKLSLSDAEVTRATLDLINSWNFDSEILLTPRMYSNRFRDLLYRASGVRLSDKFVCDSPGITSLYILNDGTVLPSQFLAYIDSDTKFNSLSLVNHTLDEIFSSEDFNKFIKLYDRKLFKNFYEPCNSCEYSGKQCNPSPLAYWLGRKVPIPVCNLSDQILIDIMT